MPSEALAKEGSSRPASPPTDVSVRFGPATSVGSGGAVRPWLIDRDASRAKIDPVARAVESKSHDMSRTERHAVTIVRKSPDPGGEASLFEAKPERSRAA